MRYIVALLAALTLAPAAAAGPVVFVSNSSTVIPQADVEAALPAFQLAVTRDLAPAWGTDATLTTDPAVHADMVVNIVDYADCWGCLGYHGVTGNVPTSYVGAGQSAFFHDSWQLVVTHELFEMLVDPWANRFAPWDKRMWIVEVADPCESGFYSYRIGDVVISDFILPGWYGAVRGKPVDFTHGLKRPGQIGRHGYASWLAWDGWHQTFG